MDIRGFWSVLTPGQRFTLFFLAAGGLALAVWPMGADEAPQSVASTPAPVRPPTPQGNGEYTPGRCAHPRPVQRVIPSPDETRIAVVRTGCVEIWDAKTRASVVGLEWPRNHRRQLSDAAWSGSGELVACDGDSFVTWTLGDEPQRTALWDLGFDERAQGSCELSADGSTASVVVRETKPVMRDGREVSHTASRHLAVDLKTRRQIPLAKPPSGVSSGLVWMWTGERVDVGGGGPGPGSVGSKVSGVAESPDGRQLISWRRGGGVQRWPNPEGPPQSLGIEARGRRALVLSNDPTWAGVRKKRVISVYATDSGRALGSFTLPRLPTFAVLGRFETLVIATAAGIDFHPIELEPAEPAVAAGRPQEPTTPPAAKPAPPRHTPKTPPYKPLCPDHKPDLARTPTGLRQAARAAARRLPRKGVESMWVHASPRRLRAEAIAWDRHAKDPYLGYLEALGFLEDVCVPGATGLVEDAPGVWSVLEGRYIGQVQVADRERFEAKLVAQVGRLPHDIRRSDLAGGVLSRLVLRDKGKVLAVWWIRGTDAVVVGVDLDDIDGDAPSPEELVRAAVGRRPGGSLSGDAGFAAGVAQWPQHALAGVVAPLRRNAWVDLPAAGWSSASLHADGKILRLVGHLRLDASAVAAVHRSIQAVAAAPLDFVPEKMRTVGRLAWNPSLPKAAPNAELVRENLEQVGIGSDPQKEFLQAWDGTVVVAGASLPTAGKALTIAGVRDPVGIARALRRAGTLPGNTLEEHKGGFLSLTKRGRTVVAGRTIVAFGNRGALARMLDVVAERSGPPDFGGWPACEAVLRGESGVGGCVTGSDFGPGSTVRVTYSILPADQGLRIDARFAATPD